jgi:hypothetical protein
MRTARPATGAAFARLKFLDRALDSAATRCFLFGRDDPTSPFVPRQRRQILPSRPRYRVRAERLAQIRWGFVQGAERARFDLVHLFIAIAVGAVDASNPSRTISFGTESPSSAMSEGIWYLCT